jgi:hypothetical protein
MCPRTYEIAAYAAEAGQIIAKLTANGNIAIRKGSWLIDFAKPPTFLSVRRAHARAGSIRCHFIGGLRMPRWNLHARDQTPQSKLLEREPQGEEGRGLTPQEIHEERLRLCWDMVNLVLADGVTLPPHVRHELETVQETVAMVWLQTRSLS